jgi:Na+-driven multidrug efflux pump
LKPPPLPPQRHRTVAERAASARGFLVECGAPAAALAGKSAVVMTLMATASGCGTVGLAAHQVLQSVNCLFTPVGEALSQTVQALLPAANARAPSGRAAAEAVVDRRSSSDTNDRGVVEDRSNGGRRLTPSGRSLVKGMLFAAVGLGSANALLAGCIPVYGAAAFTPHAGVALMLKAAAPWMAACLAFHALSTTLEGLLFASRDGAFLGRLYPLNSLAVCGVFHVLKAQHAPLPALWLTMACYNVARCVQFGSRLAFNQRQPLRQVARTAAAAPASSDIPLPVAQSA